jgi:maltose alpha-D-glucosyltransferase/alpha-amylase
VFGTGTFDVLPAENAAVLAFIRELDGSTVLCVNNISHRAQPVELDLSHYEGRAPVELLGRVEFPKIGELPYFITLGSYGFFWFELDDVPPAVT